MFLVTLTYKKPMEIVDKYLNAHRDFLEKGYQQDHFIVSGPQIPRQGGIIISQLKNKAELEEILSRDPFMLEDIADYQITEFNPVKYHPQFASFVK